MKAVPTTRFHDGHELIKVFFQSRTMQPIYCFVLVHKEGIKNRHGSAIRNHVEVRNKSTEDTNILTFTAEAKVCFVSRMFDQWRRHSAKKENMVCFRKALTYFFLGSNSLKVLVPLQFHANCQCWHRLVLSFGNSLGLYSELIKMYRLKIFKSLPRVA